MVRIRNLAAVAVVLGALALTRLEVQTSGQEGVFCSYALVDIGAATKFSVARAINNRGQVAGDLWDARFGPTEVFRTGAQAAIDWSSVLGRMPGFLYTQVSAIDRKGVVIGTFQRSPGRAGEAFRHPGGLRAGFESLQSWHAQTQPGYAQDTVAFGANDLGDVLGAYVLSPLPSGGPISWPTAEILTDLGHLSGWVPPPSPLAVPADINNHRQIVMWPWRLSPHALLIDLEHNSAISDIGEPGSAFLPTAINEHAQVVGSSWSNQAMHASMFHDANGDGLAGKFETVRIDAGVTGSSIATAINDFGVAVGFSDGPYPVFSVPSTADYYHSSRRALVFVGGVAGDLNVLTAGAQGWTLREALAINDSGQIVGWMENDGPDRDKTVIHAFRLDPKCR